MATEASPPVPPIVSIEDFAFQSRPPLSPHSTINNVLPSPPAPPLVHLQQPTLSPPHDYNFSNITYDESSAPTTDHEGAYATTDEEKGGPAAGEETTSSRSSISSLPASVMVTLSNKPSTPTRRPAAFGHMRNRSGLKSVGRRDIAQRGQDHNMTPFRHPSSVRAMQMDDEFEDDHDLTPGHRRRGSRMSAGRLSTFSTRSSNSTTTSPSKRGEGSRSGQSSPQKSSSRPRKEFPLVLLHCNLLSPTLGLNVKMVESWWLKEVLPDEYWSRWRTLEDKVLGNVEVRTRGVLIPHPNADYELLEERLLESLELERPRVRSGHFLGAQREVESTEEESEAESTQCSQCPDCGGKVPTGTEMEPKWEIKVYAANGLMRAGAWGAAWGEMEKVDVEVGVWMPVEMRREVEARLLDMGYTGLDEDDTVHGDPEASEEERRRREIYGSHAPDTQEKIDGLFDDAYHDRRPHLGDQHTRPVASQCSPPADLQSLILTYLKALAQDRRNVAITFLSIVVLFYAMTSPGSRAAFSDNASPSLRQDIVTTTFTMTATSTTLSGCASAGSTPFLEHVSTPRSISATAGEPATGSASAQDISTNESTSTTTAAETETSEQAEPGLQQIAAAFVQDEVPVAIVE